MLPAQPQSSQAAVTVKQEFKQTHTHTHVSSYCVHDKGLQANDVKIEQVTCYIGCYILTCKSRGYGISAAARIEPQIQGLLQHHKVHKQSEDRT